MTKAFLQISRPNSPWRCGLSFRQSQGYIIEDIEKIPDR
jgi:hypothetical protein